MHSNFFENLINTFPWIYWHFWCDIVCACMFTVALNVCLRHTKHVFYFAQQPKPNQFHSELLHINIYLFINTINDWEKRKRKRQFSSKCNHKMCYNSIWVFTIPFHYAAVTVAVCAFIGTLFTAFYLSIWKYSSNCLFIS